MVGFGWVRVGSDLCPEPGLTRSGALPVTSTGKLADEGVARSPASPVTLSKTDRQTGTHTQGYSVQLTWI
jgi:hypothetical protein